MAERIDRQIGQSHVYYETPGYFGPDRRDRVDGLQAARRDAGGRAVPRLEIVRNLMTGVNVVRDDFYAATPTP